MSTQVENGLEFLHPLLVESCVKIQTEVKKKASYERVKELFDYHEDGYLTWKKSFHGVFEGSVAGCVNKRTGRFVVNIDGKKYLLHRIIFLWHHGYLPELVDHEDRDFTHNWIDNLRDISVQCNARNCKVREGSSSGVTGVFWLKKHNKWAAFIRNNGKSFNIGSFSNLIDAVKARYHKEIELNWKGCNSTSSSFLFLKKEGAI